MKLLSLYNQVLLESTPLKSKSDKGNRYFEMLKTAKFQHYDAPKEELSTFTKGEEDRKRLVSKLSVEDKKKYKEWLKTPEGKESLKLFKKYETKFDNKVLKENLIPNYKYKNYEIGIDEHNKEVTATITQNGNQIGMIYLDDFPRNPYVAYSYIDEKHSGKGLGSFVYQLLDDYSFNKTGKHIKHGDISASISAIRLWRKRLNNPNYLPDGFYAYWDNDADEILKQI